MGRFSLTLSSLLPASVYLYLLIKSPWVFCSPDWPVRALSISCQVLQCPLLGILWYIHVSLVLGSPALDEASQMCLVRPHQGRISSLNLRAKLCPMQPSTWGAAFAVSVHASLKVSLVSFWTTMSFPAKMLSRWLASRLSWLFSFPRDRNWHFFLLDFM